MRTVLTSRLNPAAPEFYQPRLGTKLNPAATVSYLALRHCHRKHVYGDETRVSKYQNRRTGGSGRRGMGTRLHHSLETKTRGKYTVQDLPKKIRNRENSSTVN